MGSAIASFVATTPPYVVANYKETQLEHIEPGQRVEIEVDSFPGQKLTGQVARLGAASGATFAAVPADNATGNFTKVTQRIPLRIALDMGQALLSRLRAGMSVTTRIRPMGSVVAVVFGTLITSLVSRDFDISLADLRGAYGLSVDEDNWLNTLTNASQSLTAPVVPLMVVSFGPRRVLMHSALAFIVVTVLVPLAVGLPLVFFFHFCIGLLLGCFVPATLAIVFANLSPRYWLIALGIYSVRLTLALHTGVSLSGWLVEHVGWQAIYWQASLFAVAFLFLAAISFPPPPPRAELGAVATHEQGRVRDVLCGADHNLCRA
jgi:hypothetical protein